MNNKKFIIATIAWVVGLSALGAVTFANEIPDVQGQWMFGGMMHHGERWPKAWMGMFGQEGGKNEAAHAAVLAWDYAAFLEAVGDAPFVDKITEDQFNKMTVRAQQQNAIDVAIENNDYDAYLTAVQSVFSEKSSEEFFNDLVSKRLTAEKIKAAIEAEDYEAYVEAVEWTEREGKLTEEQFAEMIAHKADRMSGERPENMRKGMQENKGVRRWSNTNLQAAVMAWDYDAFLQAIAGTALEGKISETQFNTVVEKFAK